MPYRDVVIIGAGHSGLAMSRYLTRYSIDHVLLERGEVANSWKTERWDSLRLLTPNWMTRLPGQSYDGNDPYGFRTMPETVDMIQDYADSIAAPVQTHTTVHSLTPTGRGYRIETNQGPWTARAVVIANGACGVANVPTCAESMPSDIATLSVKEYRNPEQMADGGVLVVGASASGIQIAEEIQRSGRQVTLAVGEHVRAPRSYRGRDIQWWMDACGIFDERYDQMDNVARARHLPSLQLVGTPEHRDLDLNVLAELGVERVGRLAMVREGSALFSGSLNNVCALSDLKMNRLLDRIDEWISDSGLDHAVEPAHRFEATRLPHPARTSLDLTSGEIKTVLWATGFRPDHSWLNLPRSLYDGRGDLRHDGGVTPAAGLYLMGMPLLRTRRSTFIDGADADARDLSEHLAATLGNIRQHKAA
jgi:putative flavoprotein involved in K+ transport